MTGAWMRHHGYEKEDLDLTVAERLILNVIEVPRDATRVAGWIIRDRVDRRRCEPLLVERLGHQAGHT